MEEFMSVFMWPILLAISFCRVFCVCLITEGNFSLIFKRYLLPFYLLSPHVTRDIITGNIYSYKDC